MYANENDSFAAKWFSSAFPAAVVDQSSICDVNPHDLIGHKRVHLFAGIGGWELALRWAGWPENKPVWTGSCPCQPFSKAGKRKGEDDERHLWPEMLRLITECRPPTIFGEQVASKDGRLWLSGVRSDLEKLGYAVGAADLCAAGVGAPHIRQRLYWVANARCERFQRGGSGTAASAAEGMQRTDGERQRFRPDVGASGAAVAAWARCWDDAIAINCTDGKTRRVGSGVFPLAHGVSARMGRLRGYGNAIVPALAAEFVASFMECQ